LEHTVFFASPTRGSWLSAEYLAGALSTVLHIVAADDVKLVGWDATGSNIYVDNARNHLAHDFMTHPEKPENFFFWDDDVGGPDIPMKVLQFLRRPEDIVIGCPPQKRDPTPEKPQQEFPIRLRLDGDNNLIQQRGLLSFHIGPTGFMRIKRRVFERLAEVTETYKDIRHDGSEVDIHYFFRAGPVNGWWTGEDVYFLKTWLDLGGTAWVDPNITMTHRGEKVWVGRYGDLFTQEASLPEKV